MIAYSAFAIVRRLASCRRHYLVSAIQLFAIIHNGCCAFLHPSPPWLLLGLLNWLGE